LIYNGVFPFRRKLADISRSTRGVVVLLSDRPAAVRILEDAKRLNMMDGHFVWLWVDTAANISISDDAAAAAADKDKPPNEDRYKRSVVKSDISDMHVNYLLKNDQFLLFNRNYGVESSKFKDRNDRSQRLFSVVDGEFKGELPAGLLSLKPLPVRVDRHLVKGAVRLLIATLKLVLHRSPLWMLQSIAKGQLTTSCWKPLGAREYNFSNNFGR
jgi:ionotropic glutamate receptor NMDA 3A